MYITDYISINELCSKNCICSDAQLCIDSNIDIFAHKTISTTEILSNKSELLHASVTETSPNEYINNKETTSWIISGLLIFYIIALILSKRHMPMFGIMLFSRKNKNISYHNFSHDFAQTTNALVAFSIFIVSVFFYLIEKSSILNKTPLELFTIIAIAVCLYIVFKITTIKLVGYISENDELKSKLFAIEIIILSIYGLFSGFFLTLCFSSPINETNIWLTAISAIIILLYLFKISKIILIFINEKISPFFLILYLCAIEILPAWLIIDFL